VLAGAPFRINRVAVTDGRFHLEWEGGTGRYQVQQTANVVAGRWEPVGEPITNTSLTVPMDRAAPARFFRSKACPTAPEPGPAPPASGSRVVDRPKVVFKPRNTRTTRRSSSGTSGSALLASLRSESTSGSIATDPVQCLAVSSAPKPIGFTEGNKGNQGFG
jgi:hypothetical protein